MDVNISVPAVPRSKSGAAELAGVLPDRETLEELFKHAAYAVLPVTFRLDGGAMIRFDE